MRLTYFLEIFNRYPDSWYDSIVSNNRFFSLATIWDNQIVGILITEIKPYLECNQEDSGFLLVTSNDGNKTLVAYILTLGVVKSFRRKGIATLMIHNLEENLKNLISLQYCKAIYLHVLTTNTLAIRFYEKLHFKRFKLLPFYYSINESSCDGFCYVYYINGGRPPFWLSEIIGGKIFNIIIKLMRILQFNLNYLLNFSKKHMNQKSLHDIIGLKFWKNIFKNLSMMILANKLKRKPKIHAYVC